MIKAMKQELVASDDNTVKWGAQDAYPNADRARQEL